MFCSGWDHQRFELSLWRGLKHWQLEWLALRYCGHGSSQLQWLHHYIYSFTSLIQPFGRQKRCYSSEQWGLGLIKETGADEEIGRFSQLQNDDSWRTDLEIMRKRLLHSWWQHCSITVKTTPWPCLLPEPLKPVKPRRELRVSCVKTASGLGKDFPLPFGE